MNLNELPLQPTITPGDPNITIKLVGVGGAGANAVDRLKMEGLQRLHLAVMNTDSQALASSPVQEKVLLGINVTRGLGGGGDPELGREAAEADREKISKVVEGCDLVFLIAGMGGGTGSGAAPTVAEIASEAGALVIAFVTMPFSFEGGRRLKQAEEGLQALRRVCDAVIPLPNDILLQEGADDATVLDAFAQADAWIGRGVKSIWTMLFKTGLINLDFTALQQAFQHRGGKTLFGLGEGAGENAAADAIASLKLCPLLHTPEFARKADRLLVNIIGGAGLTLPRVNEVMNEITEQFGRNSHIIMGAVIDEDMRDRIEICVIGTSDMGGRAVSVRRPVPAARHVSVPHEAPRAPEKAPELELAGVPAEQPVFTSAKSTPLPKAVAQDEFGFGEIESRGYFEKTDRNLFDGQDLDVPTYLRKGIKISV